MASNTRWTSYNDVNEHPEDSILLAYLRKQQLEDRLKISRHIDVEKCPRCLHKLNKLKQVSTTLDALGVMQQYQHYPELSVADTYACVRRAADKRTPVQALLHQINNRQRPRASAVRLVSLPVAFGLAILFTMAMLVFANLSGQSWIPVSVPGVIRHSQDSSTVVVPSQSTPDLALTATANAGTNITPTATPVTGPYIEVCSSPDNIAHWRLVICGHNFEAGYKVALVALGKTPTWLPNLSVDKQGNFQVGWNIVNCRNLPTTIIAYEKANVKPRIVRLQNISFGSCPLLPPTMGPQGVRPGV
ncbi:MAG TPA: hypothetical protein VEL49_08165 [Ktedonobacteraceae bacterium]|nr:hypothetical protein [Ktedonobacteraceae bacterium]